MRTVKLLCPDIGCAHCAMAIRRELANMVGVNVQDVDVATKTVTLDVISDDALEAAIGKLRDIGYPPSLTS